jgi:hypothetical protein
MIEYLSLDLDGFLTRLEHISEPPRLVLQVDDRVVKVDMDEASLATLEGVAPPADVLVEELEVDDCWCVNDGQDRLYIIVEDQLRRVGIEPPQEPEEIPVPDLSPGGYGLACSRSGKRLLYQSYVQVDPDFERLKLFLLDPGVGRVVSALPQEFENEVEVAAHYSGFVVHDPESGLLLNVDEDGEVTVLAPEFEEDEAFQGRLQSVGGRLTRWNVEDDLHQTQVQWRSALPDAAWQELKLDDIACDDLAWHATSNMLACLQEDDTGGVVSLFKDGVQIESQPLESEDIGIVFRWVGDMLLTAGDRHMRLWLPGG